MNNNAKMQANDDIKMSDACRLKPLTTINLITNYQPNSYSYSRILFNTIPQ